MNVSLLMKDSSYEIARKKQCWIYSFMDFATRLLRMLMRKQSYTIIAGNFISPVRHKEYDNIEVCSVETWKQWEHIDLHTNIELSINGKPEWHAILIENKIYTPTHDDQLKRYRQIFDEAYKDGNLSTLCINNLS